MSVLNGKSNGLHVHMYIGTSNLFDLQLVNIYAVLLQLAEKAFRCRSMFLLK
jgi:hypothetical protein